MAKAYRIHIILVLHPNKTYTKGTKMDVEQISGNMDLGNKADNIIQVAKEYDEDKLDQGIDGHITVMKNRYYPDLPTCDTHFDVDTGQLAEITNTGYILYQFDWEQYLPQQARIPDFEEVEDDSQCPF